MKRFIGSILIVSILFSLINSGITVLAKMGENSTNNDVFKPTDDPIYWYEQPRNTDGTYDYSGYPLYGDPQDISDEEFFGKWDENIGAWIKTPYFRYSEFPEMELVEEAAKLGNYDIAKEELLNYYRIYGEARAQHLYSTPPDTNFDYLDALVRNTYPSSLNGAQVDIVEITDEWQEYTIDVTTHMKTAQSSSFEMLNFMISSIDKYYTQAYIYSKDSEFAPVLELEVNGVPMVKTCFKDATIIAGDNADTNYGFEEVLVAEEHGTYQNYDNTTKRIYMAFDISDLGKNVSITSAKLTFRAKVVCEADSSREVRPKEINIYRYNDGSWVENTVCWNTFSDQLWFSSNDTECWSYLTSSDAGIKGKVCCYHRGQVSALLARIADFYDDETAAREMIRQEMALINSVGCEPNVMNALDMAVWLENNTVDVLRIMNSEYMTDETFTAMLKFNWQLSNWLRTEFFGKRADGNNWSTYATSAVYGMCARYPELRDYEDWMEAVKIENERCFEGNTFSDGMCMELSTNYVHTILQTFSSPVSVSYATGTELPFTEKMKNDIYNIVMTNAYGKGPYGGFNLADGCDTFSSLTSGFKTWYQQMFPNDAVLEFFATEGASGEEPYPTVNYPVGMRTYMRSGWDEDALMLSFTNNVSRKSSHGHKDALSISVFAYGQYLLADPGYGGVLTGDIRNYFISPVQHNLVTVNDVEDYLKDGVANSYKTLDQGDGVQNAFETNLLYDFCEYSTECYTTTQLSQRSVTYLKDSAFWIVTDYAVPTDNSDGVNNLFAQHWHMYPGSDMDNDENYIISSHYNGVNIMVVPLEHEEIDDLEYVDTMYSDVSGAFQNSQKAMITKTKEGTGRFTTLLIPTNYGEDFEVETDVVETGLNPDLVNSCHFSIKNNNTGEKSYYYFYHINDISQKPAEGVEIGPFTTDASTMLVQLNESGEVKSTFLMDATFLKYDDIITEYLFKSNITIPSIAYKKNGEFVYLSSSSVTDELLKELTIYQYGAKGAMRDSDTLNSKKSGSYLYFGDIPIVEGAEEVPEDSESSKPSGDRNSGGGSGGGGGTVFPKPEINDNKESQEVEIQKPEQVKPQIAFSDVNPDDWFYEDVMSLSESEIISGNGDGTFLPYSNVTREQFVKMLIIASGIDADEAENVFRDVPSDAWYTPYVLKARGYGIINGISDTEFGIGTHITRQDVAVMLSRAIQKLNMSVVESDVPSFEDGYKASDYAKDSIEYVKSIGLMKGFDNEFRPLDKLTRAEAATIISNLIGCK